MPTMIRCWWCGEFFEAREGAKTCSNVCRSKRFRWLKRLKKFDAEMTKLIEQVARYLDFEDSKPTALEVMKETRSKVDQALLTRGIRLVKVK